MNNLNDINLLDERDKTEILNDLKNIKINVDFSIVENKELPQTGENITTIVGKIVKYLSELKDIAFTGNYSDLNNAPIIKNIESIEFESSTKGLTAGIAGAVDTYKINYSNDTASTFIVYNGEDGKDSNIEIDAILNLESENPVQNKVIKEEIDNILKQIKDSSDNISNINLQITNINSRIFTTENNIITINQNIDSIKNNLNEKVDKENGKQLSTNDYTDADKNKLAELNNYTLPPANGNNLGGVKSGGDVTITDGVISINNNTSNFNYAASNEPGGPALSVKDYNGSGSIEIGYNGTSLKKSDIGFPAAYTNNGKIKDADWNDFADKLSSYMPTGNSIEPYDYAPPASDNTTGSQGTSSNYARGNHKHPLQVIIPQNSVTSDIDYPILMGGSANSSTSNESISKTKYLTFNPSTGYLTYTAPNGVTPRLDISAREGSNGADTNWRVSIDTLSGITMGVPTNSEIAKGISYYTHDGENAGTIGAYVSRTGKLNYYYMGQKYTEPIFKVTPEGDVTASTFNGNALKNATTSVAGLMSATDKSKLSGIDEGATKTVVETSIVSNSSNPVRSSAIYTALNNKADSNSVPTAYTSNPSAPGTASAGSGTQYSRGNHVHPLQTTTYQTNNTGDSEYRLLFSGSADNTSKQDNVYKSGVFIANPSTVEIKLDQVASTNRYNRINASGLIMGIPSDVTNPRGLTFKNSSGTTVSAFQLFSTTAQVPQFYYIGKSYDNFEFKFDVTNKTLTCNKVNATATASLSVSGAQVELFNTSYGEKTSDVTATLSESLDEIRLLDVQVGGSTSGVQHYIVPVENNEVTALYTSDGQAEDNSGSVSIKRVSENVITVSTGDELISSLKITKIY